MKHSSDNGRFEFPANFIEDNDFVITDLQLEAFKRDINSKKQRPYQRIGCSLLCLVILITVQIICSFILCLVFSLINVVKYSPPQPSLNQTSKVKTLGSSHLVDKSENGAVVAGFIIGLLLIFVVDVVVMYFVVAMSENYSKKEVERKRRYLEHVCALHSQHTFATSRAEVAFTVSPDASKIHMKITPKAVELL